LKNQGCGWSTGRISQEPRRSGIQPEVLVQCQRLARSQRSVAAAHLPVAAFPSACHPTLWTADQFAGFAAHDLRSRVRRKHLSHLAGIWERIQLTHHGWRWLAFVHSWR
jgi:hypothetical protein